MPEPSRITLVECVKLFQSLGITVPDHVLDLAAERSTLGLSDEVMPDFTAVSNPVSVRSANESTTVRK